MTGRVVEPVHAGARLVVGSGVAYTEVGGCAVAVVAESGGVVRLEPETAALLLRLDGRPLAEVFPGDFASGAEVRAAEVVESLRRFKALGVIEDAPAGEAAGVPAWLDAPAVASDVTLSARVEPMADGKVGLALTGEDASGVGGGARVLVRCGAVGPVTVSVPVTASAIRAGDGVQHAPVVDDAVTEVACLGVPVTDGPWARASGDAGAPPGVVDRFVALVDAAASSGVLAEPGVVDLLARVAERVTAASWLGS